MEERQNDIDYELIARFFASEATPEENQTVEEWAAKDPVAFQQMKIVWADTGKAEPLSPNLRFDTDSAWLDFKQVNTEVIAVNSTGPSFRVLFGVAASLLLVAFGALLYAVLDKGSSPSMTVAQEVRSTSAAVDFDLIDGSSVTLNKNTTIIQQPEFGVKERRVRLEGEAFFDVEHDDKVPFKIEAGALEIKVVGTSFNVRANPGEDVEVTVVEGIVEVSHLDNKVRLVRDQSATFDTVSQQLLIGRDIDPARIFWKTKRLKFKGKPLFEVTSLLNRLYDANIEIAKQEIENCRLTADFQDESLENILDIIKLSLGLTVEQQGDKILIKGETCR